jgi:plastocyanin
MKRYLPSITIAAVLASVQLAGAADITGKVKLKGTPKPEIPIQLDAVCGGLNAKPVTTRHFVVGSDNGLANVFVYIKQGAPKAPAPAGDAPVLDQKGCMYEPYVMGVVTGQKFKVHNSDALLHNVHATPKANKEFNFAQVSKGQENEKSFDQAEVLVRMKCDVHPWMFAYIGVVDHPYFAVTDKDGNFTIKNVPPGKYTVEAYHLKAGAKTQETDGTKKLEFELEVPAS